MAVYYILDANGNPIMSNAVEWSQWFENATNRHVLLSTISKDQRISTVFLGMNHESRVDHPPVLWETMAFGFGDDDYQTRYTSREDAIAGHWIVFRAIMERDPTPNEVIAASHLT